LVVRAEGTVGGHLPYAATDLEPLMLPLKLTNPQLVR
jgi:hypothetical protein